MSEDVGAEVEVKLEQLFSSSRRSRSTKGGTTCCVPGCYNTKEDSKRVRRTQNECGFTTGCIALVDLLPGGHVGLLWSVGVTLLVASDQLIIRTRLSFHCERNRATTSGQHHREGGMVMNAVLRRSKSSSLSDVTLELEGDLHVVECPACRSEAAALTETVTGMHEEGQFQVLLLHRNCRL